MKMGRKYRKQKREGATTEHKSMTRKKKGKDSSIVPDVEHFQKSVHQEFTSLANRLASGFPI